MKNAANQRFTPQRKRKPRLPNNPGAFIPVTYAQNPHPLDGKAERLIKEGSSIHLLESVFSSIQTLIAYLDQDFNFIWVNPAYAETDGHDPDYLVGKNYFDVYPNPENEPIFRRVVRTGEPYSIYSKPVTSPSNLDRGRTYWDWTLQPVKSPSGEVNGLILILANVTPRVQTELALEKSQVMFEHLFESAPDANILVDEKGRIINLNKQVEARFGYRREELIGKPVETLLPVRSQDIHQRHRQHFAREPRTRSMGLGLELFGQHRDGSEFPVDITLSPMHMEEGLLILAVVRDITYRKEAERALKEQTSLVKLLQDIAIAANEAQSVDAALVFALDRICAHTSWPVGHAFKVTPDRKIISSHLWHIDDKDRYAGFQRASENPEYSPGVGLPGRVVESGETIWFKEILEQPMFLRKEAAQYAGIRSGFAFPVLVGREVVGVLEFFSGQALDPSTSFLDILPHIGAQVGRVIERQRQQEIRLKQELLLRTVLETLPVGVWVTDKNGTILMGNKAGIKLWAGARYVGIEAYGEYKAWWPSTGERIKPEEWAANRAIANNETILGEVVDIETFDGTRKTILNSAAPLHDSGGTIIGAIVVNEDITERLEIQADLAELQRRLHGGIEADRLHLAQELHDGPIQDLYGVAFKIQELKRQAGESLSDRDAADAVAMVQQVVNTLRVICGDLRPPTLAPFGLERAIRSHSERLKENHPLLKIHLDLMQDHKLLPESTRLGLFRIYQNLVANVIRHSSAANIWIRFRFDASEITLEIEDDGKGFVVPERWIDFARQGHLGLVGAVERAESMGGYLKVRSVLGNGTLILACLPRSFPAKEATP
jgi:PAS domain S-box-containing protein